MSFANDENELKNCLDDWIETIENTKVEESSYTTDKDIHISNKQKLDKLTNILNNKLKTSLDLLSDKCRQYFLDLFKDYNYSYANGCFKETIKSYILKQLLNDLHAIKYSFDAFQSAFNGNLSTVKDFLSKYPKYKDISGIYGTTLLYSASRNNHIHIVKYLVEHGNCFINAQNREHYSSRNELNPTSGSTALHAACYYGHLNITNYLIDHGADYFIQNDAKETPIYNGLLRENIREYFREILIFSYRNLTDNPPSSTILEDETIIVDSIWEYKSIDSDQWISFEDNQSNQLQQSLIFQPNKNYNQDFIMKINNHSYSISIIQFLCFDKTNKDHLWIRCRGSSIQNFNCYSKWQIMFVKSSSTTKITKTSSVDVFQIDHNPNTQIKIQFNHWYNTNDHLNQQLDNATNYRKIYLNTTLPFINDESFQFHLKTFTFYNNDHSIKGFIRWIPIFISINDQTIIDNFQPLNNFNLTPKFRTYSNNHSTNQLTTISTNQNHYSVS
jgi:hypothetical protein